MDTDVVIIEHCINCRLHKWCTSHEEDKYLELSNMISTHLSINLNLITVVNQIPEGLVHPLLWKGSAHQGVKKDGTIPEFPRIGSFEIYYKGFCVFSKLGTGLWPNRKAVSDAILDVKNGRYKCGFSLSSLYYSPSFKTLAEVDSYGNFYTPYKKNQNSEYKTPFDLIDEEWKNDKKYQSIEDDKSFSYSYSETSDRKTNTTTSEFAIRDFDNIHENNQRKLEVNEELSDEANTESMPSSRSSSSPEPPCDLLASYDISIKIGKASTKSIPYKNTGDKLLSLSLSSTDTEVMQVIKPATKIKAREQGNIKLKFYQTSPVQKKIVYLLVTVDDAIYECFRFKLNYL
ncbi:unnamed protein product [Blepharisma stoltei]|uniref:Uncharacterized protein n=1 Tax=Blepharisma stoltei TaxID=1481888 RepID=A0AAU9J0E4_9CILI|nr:unnamed protein product [Blepharisma stoltei]